MGVAINNVYLTHCISVQGRSELASSADSVAASCWPRSNKGRERLLRDIVSSGINAPGRSAASCRHSSTASLVAFNASSR